MRTDPHNSRRGLDAASGRRGSRVLAVGAEVALALCVGAASFTLLALALATSGSEVLAVALGAASLAAVVAITRAWGVAYAVPTAVAGLVAYDWFQFPPTHRAEFPGPADLADLLAYITLAVFVGVLAAHAGRRAVASEVARGELADEQAALRRVATLVAHGASRQEVFAAVAEEVRGLLGGSDTNTTMVRYEADGTATVVADWQRGVAAPVGSRITPEGESIVGRVLRTGRPARIDDYSSLTGTAADLARKLGVCSAVGAPIVVDGRLWGAMIAATARPESLPAGTGARIREFTELIATAISNLQARAELAASRARIAAAADEERRRVVRDLHDGAQQRLVHTVVTLKLADRALRNGQKDVPALVAEALHNAELATGELRELAQGILPAVLTEGGLRAAIEALARRTPVPVEVDVDVERLPAAVEATAYFVVAEALTNIAKHARASRVAVTARLEQDVLRVQVRDDGVGGARPDGSGLVGLADRVAALDGRLRVQSPPGGGTLVAATVAVNGSRGAIEAPSTRWR